MTREAENFLRSLIELNPSVMYEWKEERGRITSVKLKRSELSEKEIEMAMFFSKNGSPEIAVEWREEDGGPRGLSFNHLIIDDFVDEALEFDVEAFKYFHVARKSGRNPWVTGTVGLEFMSKNGLIQELVIAEKEENYERCAEILKCAESNGWELKK
jgi:hypothetical protein